MTASRTYDVSPEVIHENIDGEILAIDNRTGTYFSMRDVAATIWELLGSGLSSTEISQHLASLHDAEDEQIVREVIRFIGELAEQGLITAHAGDPDATAVPPPAAAADRLAFEPPVFEAFDDMQDLLLFDPIHEVDASGWPNKPRSA